MNLADLKIEKIYLINMEHRTERLTHSLKLLQQLQLNEVIVLPAINGSKMNLSSSIEYFTPGMVGCFLSHFFIIQNAIMQGIESIMVFEDDVKLIGNGDILMEKALPQLPSDWEFVWLGYFHRDGDQHKKIVNNYWAVPNNTHGTQAYMLRGNGLLKVYENLKKMKNQLDIQLVNFLNHSDVKVYAPCTKFFEQFGFPTDVQSR
jgi:GR25 family glycosyltransferase involved in LPS biosynthesis